MPAHQNGTAAAPAPDRSLRLARAIAAMIPGAATARVSQCDPTQKWPSPHLRAYDTHGRILTVTRAKGLTAARWIIRAHPSADWAEAHDLDLATGTLRPAAKAYAATGGGR
ncbi:hypothetical protein [Streptomyces jumonjinensis]|uniref:Uncharacterized protein n=1 Tax=Streptomyces jumonjinensis TaxID=1945 RepID=A0A646KRQ3_STRJU|nr:hypothetical protein [Streptomyces jumonjinensis]MQT04758.1 hypothetical protein [Streptomyces jumonjinensis]